MNSLKCDALILAGGFGTRLRGVVGDVPKPLALVSGRPFLHWLLDRLSACGIERVVLATGYKGDLVRQSCGECWQEMVLTYSQEAEPLGTGGAIAAALSRVESNSCLAINGDTWLDLDYQKLCVIGKASKLPLCVALAGVPDVGRYGAATVVDNRLAGFSEKEQHGAGLINAGVYWLGSGIEAYFPRQARFSFEQDVLPVLAERKLVGAWIGGREFIDIGVPEDYFAAQRVFAEKVKLA